MFCVVFSFAVLDLLSHFPFLGSPSKMSYCTDMFYILCLLMYDFDVKKINKLSQHLTTHQEVVTV